MKHTVSHLGPKIKKIEIKYVVAALELLVSLKVFSSEFLLDCDTDETSQLNWAN